MPPNHFESEVESFLEGSHGDRTHIKRADHHTVTPLCGTLLGGVCVSAKQFAPQAQNGQKMLFSGALGEFFADQQSWDPTGRFLMQRRPGRWAPLAVLTLQCAATPTW